MASSDSPSLSYSFSLVLVDSPSRRRIARSSSSVGAVAAEGMSPSSRNHCMAVHEIDHASHLALEFALPGGVVVIVVRRGLGPHAVNHPEHAIGMGVVPVLESPIELGRQDRIEPHA